MVGGIGADLMAMTLALQLLGALSKVAFQHKELTKSLVYISLPFYKQIKLVQCYTMHAEFSN